MNLFFSTAYAQTAGQSSQSTTITFVYIGIMILLFYIILWRPQSKRAKEHRELIASISKGDEVMTSGGLIGKVIKVNEEFIAVDIADGMVVTLQKSSVAQVLPKGTISQIQVQ